MADRHRSQDMKKDTDRVLGDTDTPAQQGREGGTLQRNIATQDDLKRATERPAGKTCVTKSVEREEKDA